jgi:glycolate oxidase FAD binding subunit
MNTPAALKLSRLRDLSGAENVILDPPVLERYAVDGMLPHAALRPGSAEEVAEIVRFARAEKLALIPCGSGTKLGIGMPPARYDLAVDLSRLNRVVAYDPGDLTIGVEAGIRVAALQNVLAAQHQMLPMEMPFYGQMTIGGVLASGMSGPQRQFYGTPRDYLLGAEFVTGEGRRAKSGGRVVKNVTGYDFHRLLLGSLGTLAIFTVANFRTFPQPPAHALFAAGFTDASGALALRRAIAQSPLSPVALEIASPAMARLADPDGAQLSHLHWSVLAVAAGEQAVVERHAHELKRMARDAGAEGFSRLTAEVMEPLWSRLREFPARAKEISPAATIVKLNALPGAFGMLTAKAESIASRCKLPCALLLRGAGMVYAVLLPGQADEHTLQRLASAASELLQAGAECGSAMIEFCPVELKRTVSVWGAAAKRGDIELMRRIKKIFDPDNILSPGRHVGGI